MKNKKQGKLSRQLFVVTFLVMCFAIILLVSFQSFLNYRTSANGAFKTEEQKFKNILTKDISFNQLLAYQQGMYNVGMDVKIFLEDGSDFYKYIWRKENWYYVKGINKNGEKIEFFINQFFIDYFKIDTDKNNQVNIVGYNDNEHTIDVIFEKFEYDYISDSVNIEHPYYLDIYSIDIEDTTKISIESITPYENKLTDNEKDQRFNALKQYTNYYSKRYTNENRILKPNTVEKLKTFDGQTITVSHTYFAVSFRQFLKYSITNMKFESALLVLIALIITLIYSMIVAKPIVNINKVTKKIAKLDFSNTIDIKYNNEIGELANNINLLSLNLNNSIKKLENDIEVRNEFVANFSHDIKTPLGVIKCYIESLQCNIKPEKSDEYYEICLQQIDKMSDLVNKILTISSYEQDKSLPFKQKVDLEEIINSLQSSFKLRCDTLNKKIDIIGSIYNTFGDYAKLERIISNLLNNAIEHSLDNDTITIETNLINDKYARISFSNHCIDVNPSELNKLFDRFYVGNKARSKTSTGLGLYICSVLLKQHGFEYGAEINDNYISFWFEYPIA